MASSSDLHDIKNLGPASVAWLESAGIHTREQLEALGPVEAFLRVEEQGHAPTLNLLYAIGAGLINENIHDLAPEDRDLLKAALEEARR